MNKFEELKVKQAELADLKERIEAEEPEAIKAGEEIVEAIKEIEASIEASKKAEELLSAIGTNEEANPEEEEKKNMTELKSMNLESLKGERGAVSTFVKQAATVTAPTVSTTDTKVVDALPKLGVRDLFGSEKISGNSLTYYVMGTTDGKPAVTAQGTKKPQIQPKYDPKTVALAKIAAYIKETDELLSDAEFLESAVKNRGIYEHDLEVENYLVSTLLGTSGIQNVKEAISADSILKAKMNIQTATGYEADAVILNPTDYLTLLTAKDTNGQYLFGGPAYAPYGNGAYGDKMPIWGMKVVTSSKVTAGTCIVGAFRLGASIVSKANEGFRVEVSNSNEDDFINNMVTVRIEERILEAVRIPSAFAKVNAG